MGNNPTRGSSTDGHRQSDRAEHFTRTGGGEKSNLKSQMSNKKSYIQLFTAALLSVGGLTMLFCGVFIEPHGQIHESLLIGFGEVATFAGALFGIDYVYRERKG